MQLSDVKKTVRADVVDIYAIGNPLIDIVMNGSHSALEQLGAQPGSMNLVDRYLQEHVIALGTEPVHTAGGSASNTLRAVAALSNVSGHRYRLVYTGGVGSDSRGQEFSDGLRAVGIEVAITPVAAPTGTSAILVTPDYERTMFTYLGACRELTADHIRFDKLKKSRVFHTTGYMWDTDNQRTAIEQAIETANRTGTLVSFDIADPYVVERYTRDLRAFLPGRLDLLFGNREELRRLTGERGSDESLAIASLDYASEVALKIGADGCIIAKSIPEDEKWEVHHIPGVPVDACDTTGAGDAFAGGYLYAVLNADQLQERGQIANGVAAVTVTQSGCRYDPEGMGRVLIRSNPMSDSGA